MVDIGYSIFPRRGLFCLSGYLFALFLWFSGAFSALAVPMTFQFQGHITIDGVAFEGTGYFKFSLIQDAGSANEVVVWSNDQSEGTDGEPATSVDLILDRGVYTVPLGDDQIANMAAIEPSALDGDSLSLRIWFSVDNSSFELLSPDRLVAAVPFAQRVATAETVTSLPLQLVDVQHLSPELRAIVENVPMVSESSDDSTLAAIGYRQIGRLSESSWEPAAVDSAPTARSGHVGVWTGDQFLVWGGLAGASKYLDSGGAYDPDRSTWKSLSPVNAPEGRRGSGAAWTGDSLLIWGGRNRTGYLSSGGRYDFASGRWSALSGDASPSERFGHVLNWTGNAMLVWGGQSDEGYPETGGTYDVHSDTWTSFTLPGIPTDRVVPDTIEYLAEIGDGSEGSSTNWESGVDEEAPFLRTAIGVAAADGFVYVVAQGDDALSVFDVSDPAEPSLVYSLLNHSGHGDGPNPDGDVFFIDHLDKPVAVGVEGSLLCVASQDSQSVSLFDVSEPGALRRFSVISDTDDGGDLSDLERPDRVSLSDGLLAITSSSSSAANGSVSGVSAVYLFNVSEPSSPEFLTKITDGSVVPNHDDPDTSTSVDLGVGAIGAALVEGQLIVTTTGIGAVYFFSIDHPSDPHFLAKLEDGKGDFSYLGQASYPVVTDNGELLAVSSGGGEDAVTLIDITEPGNPFLEAVVRDGRDGFTLLNHPIGTSFEGSVLVIASLLDSGVTLVDVSDPAFPVRIEQREVNGAIASAVENQVAYVVSNRSNTFKTIRFQYAPEPRQDAVSVWAEDELLVWGGFNEDGERGDGFRLVSGVDGLPESWVAISSTDEPEARTGHTAVWSGEELIVWGGQASGGFFDTGGRYNPESDLWIPMSSDGAPSARAEHSSVWTGQEMLILGGLGDDGELSDGYAYNPITDSWRTLSSADEPVARRRGLMIWTGAEGLVFGGMSGGSQVGALEKVSPEPDLFLYQKL